MNYKLYFVWMWYVLDMYHILFFIWIMLYVELPIMLYMGRQSDSGKSNKRITNQIKGGQNYEELQNFERLIAPNSTDDNWTIV